MRELLQNLFSKEIMIYNNVIYFEGDFIEDRKNQFQTMDIFSDKWIKANKYDNIEALFKFQYEWFLTLYGFRSEQALKDYLKDKKTIIDTGCGLGYKQHGLLN